MALTVISEKAIFSDPIALFVIFENSILNCSIGALPRSEYEIFNGPIEMFEISKDAIFSRPIAVFVICNNMLFVVCLSACLPAYPSVYLFGRLSVYLYVCLYE